MPAEGGGGYSDILYILRLYLFWEFNVLNSNIFRGFIFSKTNIFGGMGRLYNLLTHSFLSYNEYIDML